VQQFRDGNQLVGTNNSRLCQFPKQKLYCLKNVHIGAVQFVTFAHVRLISFRKCGFPEAKLAV
jgi:hypothetical protein